MAFMSFAGNCVAGECLLERSTLFCQRAPFKEYRPALTDESVKIWMLDVSKRAHQRVDAEWRTKYESGKSQTTALFSCPIVYCPN